MSTIIEHYQHEKGRLFVVGDIHGCYDELMQRLEQVNFDFQNDLLIAVGDVVDRGSDSLKCLNLIDEPWFKAILGNHEEMCVLSYGGDPVIQEMHAQHGGKWFYQLSIEQQKQIIERLQRVPLLLEVDYQNKKYGFVHADIDVNDWEKFKIAIQSQSRESALWGRGRIKNRRSLKYSKVSGIDYIFLGHTVVECVTQKDNCYYLDTGACFGGELTLVEINQNISIESQVFVIQE